MLKKSREAEKHETPTVGEYDTTISTTKILYPKNGIKRETDELLLEREERPFEKLDEGATHGIGPIGDRRTGKRRVSGKSKFLKK